MSYYGNDNYSDYYPRTARKKQPNNRAYLFLCAVGDRIIAHTMVLEKVYDTERALQVHKASFPLHQPVGIFNVTIVEAHLMCKVFNAQPTYVKDIATLYMDITPVLNTITRATNTGMTPVYLNERSLSICPSLTQEVPMAKLIGYVTTSVYFNLALKLFGYDGNGIQNTL